MPGGSPATGKRRVNVPLARNNDLPYGYPAFRRFCHGPIALPWALHTVKGRSGSGRGTNLKNLSGGACILFVFGIC